MDDGRNRNASERRGWLVMDPQATFDIMRSSDSTRDESRQAAVDLWNWLQRGGYPVNGWDRAQCLAECKKYMQ